MDDEAIVDKVGDLNKLATKLKREKDLAQAIEVLGQVQHEMDAVGGYPVTQYFRLPRFLMDAGRLREAWEELRRLLFSNVIGTSPETRPMDLQRVFAEMSSVFARQGKNVEGELLGELSEICWAIGLSRQERKKELRSHITKKRAKEIVGRLEICPVGGTVGRLCAVAKQEMAKYPDVDYDKLGVDIDLVLSQRTN